jgi:hypothetical protein
MNRRNMSYASVVRSVPSGFHFAVLAALLAVLARPAPAAAQQGFGNYAAAAGEAATVQMQQAPSRLTVPYDARNSVVTHRAKSRH